MDYIQRFFARENAISALAKIIGQGARIIVSSDSYTGQVCYAIAVEDNGKQRYLRQSGRII